MSPALPIPVVQLLQVVTIAAAAPGVSGRDQPGRGAAAGSDRAAHPAALLRHRQALPQGGAGTDRVELGLPRRAARSDDLLPHGAPADPGADHVRPAARLHGRHPRRRVHPVAGELPGRGRGAGHRQPVRAAGREPGQDLRGDHRAGRAVRGVHGGAGHRHRPALRAGRDSPFVSRSDHPARAPARRGSAVHGDPVRDRAHPGGDAYRHERVRDDRGGPAVRALRACTSRC